MERHKCKLCSRTFSNGRALGGHMKAHLVTLPIPPKPHHQPPLFPTAQSFFSLSSPSSYSSESEQEQSTRETEENKGVPTIYGLRENPKKSFRFSDPEFSGCDGGGSVLVFVQDRESETESKTTTTTTTTMMMMTRQRSKRNRKITPNLQNDKKPKLSFVAEPPPPPPHATEPEPMVSSVSDASTEEDVAMCLMMLSRDTWKKKINNAAKQDHRQQDQEHEHDQNEERDDEIENVKKVVRGMKKNKNNECEGCGKKFRSSRALGSHRSICCRGESGTDAAAGGGGDRVFECPFCFKIFGSGQALGGHKRSHLMGISATTSSSIVNNDSVTLKKNSRESFIDLNLPAPVEDDGGGGDGNNDGEFSAVSHVSDA